MTGKTLRQALLPPAMSYAAIGLVVSLFAHLMSLDGVRLGADLVFKSLNFGAIPLSVIVGLVMMRRFGNSDGIDVALAVAGCPRWMRWMTNAFFVYAFVNVILAMIIGPHSPQTAGTDLPSVQTWRIFSGGWMAFYATGLAALTSAYRYGITPRKCPTGHIIGFIDTLCPVCGAKIASTEP